VNRIIDDEDARWSKASLRIFSDTHSVEEIAALLGTPGTLRKQPGRNRAASWILESDLGERDLAEQLASLLDFIEAKLEVLEALLPACRIDLFCGFSSGNGQGGATFSSALLARLGKLPFYLTLDLYPPAPISTWWLPRAWNDTGQASRAKSRKGAKPPENRGFHSTANALIPELTITTYCLPFRPR
jgi:hypothetical protein